MGLPSGGRSGGRRGVRGRVGAWRGLLGGGASGIASHCTPPPPISVGVGSLAVQMWGSFFTRNVTSYFDPILVNKYRIVPK